jgi:peptidoglycan/LPS O-acetylase OafA/YrhL
MFGHKRNAAYNFYKVKNTKHYRSLDGLRGLAALVVVLLHNLTAFAPFLIAGFATQRHSSIDRLISASPFD